MIREYVEGHEFNETRQYKSTLPPHRKMWIIKGAINIDGVPHGFAAWDYSKGKAEKFFQTFLNPKCICTIKNRDGKNPSCPVHKDWSKLIKKIGPIEGEDYDLGFREAQG